MVKLMTLKMVSKAILLPLHIKGVGSLKKLDPLVILYPQGGKSRVKRVIEKIGKKVIKSK